MAMAVGRRLKANVSTATTISQRGQPGRVGSADSGTAVTLWRLARLAAVATRTQPEQHAPPVQRLRIKYAKRGRARFTSHRDFGRAFERALRRAAVPMAYSSGFSPHPRISYANAAPTGAASEAEYLEIGLAAACDPAAVQAALDAALPPGLDIVEVVVAPPGALGRPAHRLALAGRPGRRVRRRSAAPPCATSWPSRKCWSRG